MPTIAIVHLIKGKWAKWIGCFNQRNDQKP
jgi:hypothetical protein